MKNLKSLITIALFCFIGILNTNGLPPVWMSIISSANNASLASYFKAQIDTIEADSLPIVAVTNISIRLQNEPQATYNTDKALVDLAYLKMMEGFSRINDYSKKHTVSALLVSDIRQRIYATQHYLLVKCSILSSSYSDSLKLMMDETVLLRDEKNYDAALNRINQLVGWVKPENLKWVLKWQCWISRDKMIADSLLSASDAMDKYDCLLNKQNQNNSSLSPVVISQNPLSIRKTKTIGSTTDLALSIYPNPVCDELNATLTSSVSFSAGVSVIDITGKVLSTNPTHFSGGTQNLTINTSSLSSGLYVLRISNGSKFCEKKFLVDK